MKNELDFTADLNSRGDIKIDSASRSRYEGYVVLSKFDRYGGGGEFHCYMGKEANYSHGYYDNSDGSLVYITDNRKVEELLSAYSGYVISQQEMLDKGIFTDSDYAEYDMLSKTVLKQFGSERPLLFNVKVDDEGETHYDDAEAFSYPMRNQGVEKEESETICYRRGRGR